MKVFWICAGFYFGGTVAGLVLQLEESFGHWGTIMIVANTLGMLFWVRDEILLKSQWEDLAERAIDAMADRAINAMAEDNQRKDGEG